MSSHLGKELGKEELVEVGYMSPLTRHSSQGNFGGYLNFAIDPLLLPFI